MTKVPSIQNFKPIQTAVQRVVAMFTARKKAPEEKLKTKIVLKEIYDEEPYLAEIPHYRRQ